MGIQEKGRATSNEKTANNLLDMLQLKLQALREQGGEKWLEFQRQFRELSESPLFAGAFLYILDSIDLKERKLYIRIFQLVGILGLLLVLSLSTDKDTFPFGIEKALAMEEDVAVLVADGHQLDLERPTYLGAASPTGPDQHGRQLEWPIPDHRLPEVEPPEEKPDIIGIVKTHNLILRAEPGINSPILGYLPKGSRVTILEEVRDRNRDNWTWYYVETEDGEEGCVSPPHVNKIDPDAEIEQPIPATERMTAPVNPDPEPEQPISAEEPEAVVEETNQENAEIPKPTEEKPELAPPAPEYDYNVIPEGYDCAGTRAALRACQDHGVRCVFTVPGMGPIHDNLARRWLVAQTFEDDPLTRDHPGCYPEGCIFWNAPMLLNNGYGEGSVYRITLHELVHIDQSKNDANLAEHLDALNPNQAPLNFAYQCVIEGHAETTGCQVGNSHLYYRFRAIYGAWKQWAADNGKLDLFSNAANGDWNAYLEFVRQFQELAGVSLEDFVRRY